MKNLKVISPLKSFEEYLNALPIFVRKFKDYPKVSDIVLKIGAMPDPFDAFEWLKTMDDKDFKQIFQFYNEDHVLFLYVISIALRAKMGEFQLTNKVEEPNIVRNAYIIRVKFLILTASAQRADGKQVK